MSLFGKFMKQFIDVIDWTEEGDGILAYRYPVEDREIQNGAQLTVRETQAAMFVNEGEVADIFAPGRYTLTTKTLPVLTSLKNWDKLFDSPFKSDIYFFSLRHQTDQKWGTPNTIVIRDKEMGPIRLRAHGSFSYRIRNPAPFFKKISGTREAYTASELQGQLRAIILTSLASFFGSSQVSFLDMAASQTKFSQTLKDAIAPEFEEYGLQLESFYVQSISLPDELQKHLDKVSGMNMIGDLKKYAQFQAADSLGVAAANPGGAAGAGMGIGVGAVMGQTMAEALGAKHSGGGDSGEDPIKTIGRLHDLVKAGALTQAEFDAKKAELLKKLT